MKTFFIMLALLFTCSTSHASYDDVYTSGGLPETGKFAASGRNLWSLMTSTFIGLENPSCIADSLSNPNGYLAKLRLAKYKITELQIDIINSNGYNVARVLLIFKNTQEAGVAAGAFCNLK